MGYINHNALLGISWNDSKRAEAAKWVQARADARFFAVSPVFTNGYWTLVCFPDGSKEGWAESDDGDRRRDEAAEFLKSLDKYCKVVEISLGEDGWLGQRVSQGTDEED